MIRTKKELMDTLQQDAKANRRTTLRASVFGDEVWKFIKAYRYREFYSNNISAGGGEKISLHTSVLHQQYCISQIISLPELFNTN